MDLIKEAAPKKKYKRKPAKKPRDLNHRQHKFIEAFLTDPCVTRAAKEAGYSVKAAYSVGSALMKNPAVLGAIRQAQAEAMARTGDDLDSIILGLDKMIKKYDRLKQGSVVFRCWELKAKLLGVLEEKKRVELTGADGKPIEVKNYEDLSDDELSAKLQRSLTRINQDSRVN